MEGKDRVIVALDVPTHDEAVALVDRLDNVSFFKVGLELFLAGDLYGLLRRLQVARGDQGAIFVDLKIAGDITNTIVSFVRRAAELGIRFITFVEAAESAITRHSLEAGREARRETPVPQFLMVSLPSSLGATSDRTGDVDTYIVDRGHAMLDAGCDGLVVSGSAIGACRQVFPNATLVSPGIRPSGAPQDDHARWTTPADAVRQGADYLVVGRPIRTASNPRDAAQRIIDEIDEAAS